MRNAQDQTRIDNSQESAAPEWVMPFWMLLAFIATFIVGCGCGSLLTLIAMAWSSMASTDGHHFD